jgi:hypothetical protein
MGHYKSLQNTDFLTTHCAIHRVCDARRSNGFVRFLSAKENVLNQTFCWI